MPPDTAPLRRQRSKNWRPAPARDVQSAAGSLSDSIKYWNIYDSSIALLREADYKKKERRNNIISGCIYALVHRTRGQAFGLLEGIRSALARVFSILLLSLLSFGGVYVIRILTEKLKLRLGRWMAELAGFAATFAESGIMLATDYALVVLMAEKVGLMEAFRRTKDLVRGGRGPALW